MDVGEINAPLLPRGSNGLAIRSPRSLVDDELKLARARIYRQVVDREHLEAHVVHPFAREDLASRSDTPFIAAARCSASSAESRQTMNRNASVTEQVHLKARHARDEDLVDRVRADEVLAAVAVS